MCACLVDDGALIVRYLGQNDAPVRDDCDSLIHTLPTDLPVRLALIRSPGLS